MGFRFGKSIKLGKGVRLNVSKKGLGISAGVKGFRVGTGPRGTRATASIPGTGISYSQKIGGKKKRTNKSATIQNRTQQSNAHLSKYSSTQKEYSATTYKVSFIVLFILAAISLIPALFAPIFLIFTAFCLIFAFAFKSKYKQIKLGSENSNQNQTDIL